MKNLISAALTMMISSLCWANDPLSCIKTAVTDSTVLVANKAYYTNGPEDALNIEKVAGELCASASGTNDPINCLKTALSDAEVLKESKAYYRGPENALHIENDAVLLCSGYRR